MDKKEPWNRITLDAWAVLAWLQGEPAGEMLKDLIDWAEGNQEARARIAGPVSRLNDPPQLFINLINLGEVFYILGRRKGREEARSVVKAIRAGPIGLVEPSEPLVFAAATLKMTHTISFADAFAVATAQSKNSPLLTGDPEIKGLPGVRVIWLGQRD